MCCDDEIPIRIASALAARKCEARASICSTSSRSKRPCSVRRMIEIESDDPGDFARMLPANEKKPLRAKNSC
jgi:hypothetical protein